MWGGVHFSAAQVRLHRGAAAVMTVVVWEQVAGTNVYEEKKEESLKIMKESDTKVPPALPSSPPPLACICVSPRAMAPMAVPPQPQLLTQRSVALGSRLRAQER